MGFSLHHKSKVVSEVVNTSTVEVEAGEKTQGGKSDADGGKYEKQQIEKEIVAASVIGGCMVLVVLVFGLGVWIAWRRKVGKYAMEKGAADEACELREVETSPL